jgi:hypothetical protein
METWRPITAAELDELIASQLLGCEPSIAAVFESYKVAPFAAPIERNGRIESVFVVARKDNEVMYYEDVEEGFNFSPISPDGRILEHWCNQDDLGIALRRWLDAPGIDIGRGLFEQDAGHEFAEHLLDVVDAFHVSGGLILEPGMSRQHQQKLNIRIGDTIEIRPPSGVPFRVPIRSIVFVRPNWRQTYPIQLDSSVSKDSVPAGSQVWLIREGG